MRICYIVHNIIAFIKRTKLNINYLKSNTIDTNYFTIFLQTTDVANSY